jgi:tRNA(adenine34) deaminase
MTAKFDEGGRDRVTVDAEMMERCIRLSGCAVDNGELPFAALICIGERVVVETTNQVFHDGDVTRHAELIAVSEAQKILGRKDLADCTLYTNVEPCPMCSFAIRETGISRVVFAIRSPMMGGLSKWNVLRDHGLSETLPEVFGSVPEVVAGLLQPEAEKIWWKWNPLFWTVMKYRGYLGGNGQDGSELLHAIPERRGLLRRFFARRNKRPA